MGAAELAVAAAELMECARELGYGDLRLERLARRLTAAHPAMAAVWNAVHAGNPQQFRRAISQNVRETVGKARRVLPRGAQVLTLSYSSTVLAALSRRDLSVVVCDSLPGGEGRRVVRKLKRAGVDATSIPDAGLAAAAREVDCAIVGADAVTPHFVVNKLGTHLLALACQEAGAPCYAAADASKFVSESWPLPPSHPSGLFEATPIELFSEVLSGGR